MKTDKLIEFVKNNKIALILWSSFVIFSQFFKISALFGSQKASLTCLTVALPLVAYFFPISRALPLLALGWIATHFAWPVPITMGIPTLMATLSWNASKDRKSDLLFHTSLPILSMILFYFSSVGQEAWAYSLYWLIPFVLAFIPMGIVGRALKSTFIAHAMGSVIWVYIIPMTSHKWLCLIPIVAIERLVSMALMLTMIGVIHLALRWNAGQKEISIAH